MRRLLVFTALLAFLPAIAAEPTLPIRSGRYIFRHKFAEQPDMPSITVVVTIRGHHIVVVNESESNVFPKGVLDEGTLKWHSKSRQWFISDDESDQDPEDVGGCSDGPEVVDLKKKIYWTC